MLSSQFRIENLSGLACLSITAFRCTWSWAPQAVAKTTIHRLAHLIVKLEIEQRSGTAQACRWYLDHLNLIPIAGYEDDVEPFVNRLRNSLRAFEERRGQVSPDWFENFVKLCRDPETVRRRILYGVDFNFGPHYSSGSSSVVSQLSEFISFYMWRQNMYN